MLQRMNSVVLAMALMFHSATGRPQTPDSVNKTPLAVKGEYLLEINSPLSDSSVAALFNTLKKQFGLIQKRRLPKTDIYVVQQREPPTTSFIELMSIPDQHSQVALIEPNYIFELEAIPNDPLFPLQWSLKNTGQHDPRGLAGVEGADINVEEAWNLSVGSPDVVVAVIDSGINYLHPDLKANIWTNLKEQNGTPGVDDDHNGYIDDIHGYNFADDNSQVMDERGHGSHCAGIIGAYGNNGVGMTGVNWKIQLMAAKFAGQRARGTLENALEAIQYVAANGAQIINASWGSQGQSRLMEKALAELQAKNILFVAAAGNSSSDNDKEPVFPASIHQPHVLAVAAMDNRATLARFSNYELKSVHIAAPGVNIRSTVLEEAYEVKTGTSMAAPFVTGVSALLLAKNPQLKAEEIKARIINTAKPHWSLQGRIQSGGMLNALGALQVGDIDFPEPSEKHNESSFADSSFSCHSP